MHRYQAGGLTRGAPGADEIARRLGELSGKLGGELGALLLPFSFARALGTMEAAEKDRKRGHVYLCRYMHLSLDAVEAMPIEDVRDYMEELADCIRGESPTPAGPGHQ